LTRENQALIKFCLKFGLDSIILKEVMARAVNWEYTYLQKLLSSTEFELFQCILCAYFAHKLSWTVVVINKRRRRLAAPKC